MHPAAISDCLGERFLNSVAKASPNAKKIIKEADSLNQNFLHLHIVLKSTTAWTVKSCLRMSESSSIFSICSFTFSTILDMEIWLNNTHRLPRSREPDGAGGILVAFLEESRHGAEQFYALLVGDDWWVPGRHIKSVTNERSVES